MRYWSDVEEVDRMKKVDVERFMREAIRVAYMGIEKGQSPFGAVVVDRKTGEIVARAYNTVVKDNDPTAHAEVNAIRKAARKLKTYNLKGHVIFSTCEPCPMCFSAIHWANLDEVYFGATIEDAERCGFREIKLHNREIKRLGGRRVRVRIHDGVLRDECVKMMNAWKKRKDRVRY